MSKNQKRFYCTAAIAFIPTLLVLQSTNMCNAQGTKADYARMNQQRRLTQNKVFRVNVKPNWIHDEKGMWYRVETAPAEFEFVVVDIKKKIRKLAFDHPTVATQLSDLSKKTVDPKNLPFQKIFLDDSLQSVFFKAFGKTYLVDRANSKVSLSQPNLIPPQSKSKRMTINPSGPSEVSIHITFENKTTDPIRLFWIDTNKRPKAYGLVPPNQTSRQHTYAGHVWIVTDEKRNPLLVANADSDGKTFTITKDSKVDTTFPLQLDEQNNRRRRDRSIFASSNPLSPDKKWRIAVRDYNLFLTNQETKEEIALVTNGRRTNYFTSQIFWAPDSKKVIVLRERPGDNREIHMIDSSPSDQQQPKLVTAKYAKPGDKIRTQTPILFDITTKKKIDVDTKLFDTPWRIRDFRWSNQSDEFFFRYNQRGHQVMRIVGIHAQTGKARAVIDEVTKTFIDYNYKFMVNYLNKSNELIWSSERDGWNHLYLYDSKTGKLKNQITKGKWLVRKIDRVDEEKRQIWFQASGILPNQDPYYLHFCRVDFSGENLVLMTAGDGTHSINYSPSGNYLVDRYSKVDMPAVHEIRNVENGELVCRLEKGDDSRLRSTGWKSPERFISTARDGRTPIFGVIYRPSNFDPEKKYPVVEYIYAGPHGSFVPKSYSAYSRTHAMAELGFIMVQIDGMGTSNRSKAFHDVCWKNLGDSGFPDRILWMKTAAKQYPQLDLTRVGIFGGSAGGQSSTRALLAHGDFYKVAVSDCGCHDNQMDKIWWNEQWMGWPIGPHYKAQSNVTNAHKLTGKLFLIVGELDRNVDPASTMQVVDALIKSNKDFDLLVVPGGGHGIGSRPYGMRRTQDFFVRHLLGNEPRTK